MQFGLIFACEPLMLTHNLFDIDLCGLMGIESNLGSDQANKQKCEKQF